MKIKKVTVKQTKFRLIVLIMVFCLLFYYSYVLFFNADDKIKVIIKNGDNAISIASYLEKNNFIFSKELFLGLVKIANLQKKFKAGIYNFSKKDSIFKILRKLTTGPDDILRLTIPEGNTVKQTAEIISRVIDINKERFIKMAEDKNIEGYLMPETYFITFGMNEEQLIKMMLSEFYKKITPQMYERAKKININFKDIIIMASIIEKETVKNDEKPIIASIFYNRLNRNIKLQSCATVLYAMGINKPKLTYKDIKFNSQYNTYIHFGLPPGPICSPGIESIKAALYPSNTKNMFFVSEGYGRHLFAKNFEEHKKNISILKNKVIKGNKLCYKKKFI
ncbi:MAG: endolytic transglycosylase MltG [Endomicrobium sp.]|jgi:UPF0755 protein|nr:endolytic transglycosylase MltG [Endomicrobium sp.]